MIAAIMEDNRISWLQAVLMVRVVALLETLREGEPRMPMHWIRESVLMSYRFRIRCQVTRRSLTCPQLQPCRNLAGTKIRWIICLLSKVSAKDQSLIPSFWTKATTDRACKTTTSCPHSLNKLTCTVETLTTTKTLNKSNRLTILIWCRPNMPITTSLARSLWTTSISNLKTTNSTSSPTKSLKRERTMSNMTTTPESKLTATKMVKVMMTRASQSTWLTEWSWEWSKLKVKTISTWWIHRDASTTCKPTLLAQLTHKDWKRWDRTVKTKITITIRLEWTSLNWHDSTMAGSSNYNNR